MKSTDSHSLIVVIVRKGCGDTVVEACLKAGADGATVMFGRGVGIHERQKFLGIPIEPEKEIVLSVVPRDKAEMILDKVEEAADLDKPGTGIGFILPVEKVVGIIHTTIGNGQDR